MTAIALPAPYELPRLRLPRWTRPWERTLDDTLVAAIGTPTSVGAATGNSNSATIQITVTASVSIGGVIIVSAAVGGGSGKTCTFSDSAGNTWATDATSNAAGNNQNTFIGSAIVTNALTSGVSTITATFSAGANARHIAAVQVSGLAAASIFDQSSVGAGTATGWSSGASPATTQADELVIGACSSDTTTAQTSTPGTGYTELFDQTNGGANQLTVIYQIVAATGAQTASGTWSSGTGLIWKAAVATYKGAAGAKSLVSDQRRGSRNSLLRRHHEPREPVAVYMNALRPNWRPRPSGILAPSYS